MVDKATLIIDILSLKKNQDKSKEELIKEILPILEELHDESMKLGIRKVKKKLVSLTNEFNDD